MSRGESGHALPLVLAFASAGLIVVTAYLAHQGRSNTGALQAPAELQAALNARSGIYRALDHIIAGRHLDSIDTFYGGGLDDADAEPAYPSVDDPFSMDMFDGADAQFGHVTPEDDLPGAKTILLYVNDSVNTADIYAEVQGLHNRVTSRSAILGITRYAEALLGCGAPAKPDTVLILGNDLPAKGNIRGIVHHDVKLQSALTGAKSVNERISSFITSLARPPLAAEDTAMFGFPLNVRSSVEAALIPDTVKAHLTLDGAFSGAVWKERRKITVYGDLQIVGSFRIENLEFDVEGEIRLLDNAHAANVSMFSARRIFIGDNAVFHGSAVSMGSVNVYGSAEVKKGSSVIAAGRSGSTPGRYSIFLSENSVFNGAAIAVGSPGGIKTEQYAKQTGILWAQKAICHGGRLTGIIRAEYLINCFDPVGEAAAMPTKVKANVFTGTIEPLPSIGDYNMPFFMGTPRVISMREY